MPGLFEFRETIVPARICKIALTRGRVGRGGLEGGWEGVGDERGPSGLVEEVLEVEVEGGVGRTAIEFRADRRNSWVGCEVEGVGGWGDMVWVTASSSSMSRLLRMEGGFCFVLFLAAPGFVTISQSSLSPPWSFEGSSCRISRRRDTSACSNSSSSWR